MWILCGILSAAFCVAGWVLALQKHPGSSWASVTSLALGCLTLLMQYKLVFLWVQKGDWTALLDVVPSMFSILTGYVILLLLANTIPLLMIRKQA